MRLEEKETEKRKNEEQKEGKTQKRQETEEKKEAQCERARLPESAKSTRLGFDSPNHLHGNPDLISGD